MQTYTSIELTSRGPFAVSRAMPDRDDHDTLMVRILRAGICNSDLKEVSGTRAIRRDFGHELVAIMERSGPCKTISTGSLVTFDPHIQIERSSGFAEFMLARGNPDALSAAFPLLPEGISADRAVFVEPLACGHHAVARLSRCMAETGHGGLRGVPVAVLGAGLTGTLQSLILKSLEATPTLFNRDIGRLNMLTQRGLFRPSELAQLQPVPNAAFDAIIISTSFITYPLLLQAMTMARPNGVVLLFGGTSPGMLREQFSEDIDMVRREERLKAVDYDGKTVWLAGTHGATFYDFAESIRCLADRHASFPVERLIVDRVKLGQLPQRLTNLTSGGASHIGKIVVDIAADSELPPNCRSLVSC